MSLFHEHALDIYLINKYLSINDIKKLSYVNTYYRGITAKYLETYRNFFNRKLKIKHIEVPYITVTVLLEKYNTSFIVACDEDNLLIAKYLYLNDFTILHKIIGSKSRHTYDPCKLYEYLIIRGIYTNSKNIIAWLLSFNIIDKTIIDRIIDNQLTPEILYIFGQHTEEKRFYNACWNNIMYDIKIFLPIFYKYAVNGLRLAKFRNHSNIVELITIFNYNGYFLHD